MKVLKSMAEVNQVARDLVEEWQSQQFITCNSNKQFISYAIFYVDTCVLSSIYKAMNRDYHLIHMLWPSGVVEVHLQLHVVGPEPQTPSLDSQQL